VASSGRPISNRIHDFRDRWTTFLNLNKSKSPTDIMTDGTHLSVVDDSTTDKVFKYTVSGSHLGNWTVSAGGGSPTGITLDPSQPNHLWIVDSGTNRVYQYDGATALTGRLLAASTDFALAPGNTNPQGIADPNSPPPFAGDSNRDGIFNSAGLVLVFQVGEYEDDVAGTRRLRREIGMAMGSLIPGIWSSRFNKGIMSP
jgi:hypothetical protein